MANPAYVNGLVSELLEIVEASTASTSTKDWWSDRLNAVRNGEDWARNPWGFFLKGIAPRARRDKNHVLAQFRSALISGHTADAERLIRRMETGAVSDGTFESFARRNSQYGSLEARVLGSKVAKLADENERAGIAPLLRTANNEADQLLATVSLNAAVGRFESLAARVKAAAQHQRDALTPEPATVPVPVPEPTPKTELEALLERRPQEAPRELPTTTKPARKRGIGKKS